MRLLIGAPVAHRDWIIDRWYRHAVAAGIQHDLEFVVAAHPDDPTPAALMAVAEDPVHVVTVDEPRPGDQRVWSEPRFAAMARIRNQLLGAVRDLQPDLFLSLDSDILLHPDALAVMVDMIEKFDAASSACFLSRPPRRKSNGEIGAPSWRNPNYAMLSQAGQIRREWRPSATMRVDAIMAIKLMLPAVYSVDYQSHPQGEDCGWGLACRYEKVSLGWTSMAVSKHVMDSTCDEHAVHDPSCADCVDPLTRVDPRCGY